MEIAICDDDKVIREQIRGLIKQQRADAAVALYESGEELLACKRQFDLVFLDIQMKGIDGMETARKLRRQKFKGLLIFITVLREMVFQSFEVQPYDYLVKPIEKKHFQKMMERLLDSMKNASEENLLVQKGYESRIISIGDIVFCEIIDRKIYLHLVSSEVIDYYDRIENLEKKLDHGFFRCHRSFLIHLKYLKGYKNGTAYMENGREIPVSRLRSKEFSNVILQYMKCEGNDL